MPSPFYNALLDPSNGGTIGGFVGGLLGSPTRSEASGSATGNAMKELMALRDQGLNPQQALTKFMQSETGVDFFVRNPNGLGTLTNALAASQPPAPTLHNLGPGAALYRADPGGDVSQVATNPKEETDQYGSAGNVIYNKKTGQPVYTGKTNDQQNFDYFAGISGLPPTEIAKLAQLQINPNKQPSDTAAALTSLVNNYGLDPQLAMKIQAGTLKVLPIKDNYGQDTGDVSIVDLTNPNIPSVTRLSPGVKTPQNNGAPGTTPENGSATGVIPPAKPTVDITKTPDAKKYFGDKGTMFLSAGIVPNTLEAASKAGEQIDPSLIIPEGAKASDRRTLIAGLRSALSSMSELGAGLSVNKKIIDNLLDLSPSASITDSPHSSVQKGIRLLQTVQSEIAAKEAETTNMSLPAAERINSAKVVEAWRRVERAMPTMPEMQSMEKAIREGTAGAPNLRTLGNAVVDQAGKAFTSGKQQIDQTRSDIASPSQYKFETATPDELGDIAAKTNGGRDLSPQDKLRFKQRVLKLKAGANGPQPAR